MCAQLSEEEIQLTTELRSCTRDILSDDFELSNSYLLTWVRYARLDIKKAEQSLRNHKKWRDENNMGTILTEDMSKWDHGFNIEINRLDKEGHPIFALKMDRDGRAFIETYGTQAFVRYMLKICETIISKIRKQYFLTEGRVYQFSILSDMEGFSWRQLASTKSMNNAPTAVSTYIEMLKIGEKNYPGIIKNFYLLNAPGVAKNLIRLMKPFMSPETTSRLKVFGKSSEWKDIILQEIDEDQLPSFLRNSLKEAEDSVQDLKTEGETEPCPT